MMSVTDSKVLDANSEAQGVSVSTLMDNAGSALSDFLLEHFPDKRFIFICGTGNNGGDGFAAALRMPPERTKVALLRKASEIRSDIARDRYSVLECDIVPYSRDHLVDADVIVDCILGTGSSGMIREPYSSCITDVNSSGKIVVSADIPSGLGADIAVHPDYTITFHDIKSSMSTSTCGEIIVCDIGIPDEAYTFVGPGDMIRYPVPSKNSHKGQNGRLMIVGGGPYFGAPAMSGMSALRSGVDCVRIYTPSSSAHIVSSYCPVFMVTELPGNQLTPESVPMILEDSSSYDALLIGPGLGDSIETQMAVRDILKNIRIPVVIDADGILPSNGIRMEVPCVLTPHHGEFAKLSSEESSVEEVALSMNAVMLLKGSEDIITDGVSTRRNKTGNAGMTGAGTGDVLSGCVAGLLAKGVSAFDSACLGAYICGMAGDIAFESFSFGLIATDVIDNIPKVISSR